MDSPFVIRWATGTDGLSFPFFNPFFFSFRFPSSTSESSESSRYGTSDGIVDREVDGFGVPGVEFDLADGLMGALADGLGELADESLGLVEDVLGVDGAVLDRRVDDEWMINLLGLFVPLSTPIVLGLMGNDSLSLSL